MAFSKMNKDSKICTWKKGLAMELGERIQEVLDIKGLTQADLCRMTQLTSASISKVINGSIKDPRLSTIIPIAKALGVSLDYLVFSTSAKTKPSDKWQEQLNANYELLGDKARLRLLEGSQILIKLGMFKGETEFPLD